MSILFLPALLFRKIAMEHNKKGWLFFLFGLAVGMFALNVGRLALYPLTGLAIADEYKPYLSVVIFIVGYAIIFFAITFLRRKLTREDKRPPPH